jgi:hypothetical protein
MESRQAKYRCRGSGSHPTDGGGEFELGAPRIHGELIKLGLNVSDEAIRGYRRLIEKLPPVAKNLWKNASNREFDIGIQAGKNPAASEWLLDVEMLRDVAKNRAQIELTVYSPVLRAGQINPSSARR